MTWGAYDIVIKYHSIYLTINKIGFKECTLSIFAVVDISDFSWKRSHTEGTLVCNTDSWHYSGGLRSKIKISLKINIPQQFRKMFQERLPVMKEGYFVRGTVILLEFLLFILLSGTHVNSSIHPKLTLVFSLIEDMIFHRFVLTLCHCFPCSHYLHLCSS